MTRNVGEHGVSENVIHISGSAFDFSTALGDLFDHLRIICHFDAVCFAEAALNLAVTYNDRGKYEKAREVYSRIKVSPAGASQGLDPFARGKIANMHAEVGQAYADAGLPIE